MACAHNWPGQSLTLSWSDPSNVTYLIHCFERGQNMLRVLLCLSCLIEFAGAQQSELPLRQVGWMRVVNTVEAEFKAVNGRYANADELTQFATSRQQGADKQYVAITRDSMAPYSLNIVRTPDGAHYVASIKRFADMKDQKTWCKTSVYSDDSGTIDVGQNIGCEGAVALGTESKPVK